MYREKMAKISNEVNMIVLNFVRMTTFFCMLIATNEAALATVCL